MKSYIIIFTTDKMELPKKATLVLLAAMAMPGTVIADPVQDTAIAIRNTLQANRQCNDGSILQYKSADGDVIGITPQKGLVFMAKEKNTCHDYEPDGKLDTCTKAEELNEILKIRYRFFLQEAAQHIAEMGGKCSNFRKPAATTGDMTGMGPSHPLIPNE